MANVVAQPADFESAKARLEEIANAVDDETLPLDEALDLFDEAVAIGLSITDFLEDGIVVEDEPEAEADGANDAGLAAAPAAATAGAGPEPTGPSE